MKSIAVIGVEILDTYYFKVQVMQNQHPLKVYAGGTPAIVQKPFPNTEFISDLSKMMEDPTIKVVYISDKHLSYASAFLGAGKSVIVI